MDEQALLLLGILKSQSQHGYQINEFIEKNLSRVTDMKKATAYAVLERLCKAGFVSVSMEQEGNRPQRKVYTITPAGETQFLFLLRENLSQAEQLKFSGDIGLMFIDHLTEDEMGIYLEQRLKNVDLQIITYEAAPKHGIGVDLAIEHILIMLKTEKNWLSSVLQRLL